MRICISRLAHVGLLALLLGAILLTGCTASFKNNVVALRNAQGDTAMENGNVVEAEKEYGLALALAPSNEHARAGYARVLYLHAKENFAASKLDDAYAEVQKALVYAPKDAATLDLASAIDQAMIRRDVVVQNFPTYKTIGDSIGDTLKGNALAIKEIQLQLHAFHSDYDVVHLRKAIDLSYELEQDQHRATQRLIAYKAQVEAGAPGQTPASSQEQTPGLLPIP